MPGTAVEVVFTADLMAEFDQAGIMVRIDEESGLGFAVATDANGRYCQLDPYLGAQLALAEAYRNVAATGATPAAGSRVRPAMDSNIR